MKREIEKVEDEKTVEAKIESLDKLASEGKEHYKRLSTFLQVTICAKEDYDKLKEIVLKLEQEKEIRNSQDKLRAIALIKIYDELLCSVNFLED